MTVRRIFKGIIKVLKCLGIIIPGLIIILLIVCFIGKMYYNRTPQGGINESIYIEVNGQQQWLSIYGEDKNNPVLLYLHGGPGDSSSLYDYRILRKLANDYTVVNWDQRDAGKTWIHDPQDTAITSDLLRSDIDAVTDFVLDYTGKSQLTLLGISWGTMYAGDYAFRHPEKVERVFYLSPVIVEDWKNTSEKVVFDYVNGDIDFQTFADKYGYAPLFNFYKQEGITEPEQFIRIWEAQKNAYLKVTEDDRKYHAYAEKIDIDLWREYYRDKSDTDTEARILENFEKYEPPIQNKYGNKLYSRCHETPFDGDFSPVTAVFFNPYYSLSDLIKYEDECEKYKDNVLYETLTADFTLKSKTDYQMPVYIFEGKYDDYNIGEIMKNYYESITAPDKDFRYVEGGHMSAMLNSEELLQFVQENS